MTYTCRYVPMPYKILKVPIDQQKGTLYETRGTGRACVQVVKKRILIDRIFL